VLGGKTDAAGLQGRPAYHVSKVFCPCDLRWCLRLVLWRMWIWGTSG